MKEEQENFYLDKEEPVKSCLLTLHDIILNANQNIKPCWKYKIPCFCLEGKMFCYLWIDKRTNHPYIGFVDGNLIKHPKLVQEKRKKMKVLPINPNIDIPIELIEHLLEYALEIRFKK